jgi:hypothetical protein
LAAVGFHDPDGRAIGCGHHRVPLTIGLDLGRVVDRVGLEPRLQVGRELEAAVRIDPVEAGRLVRVAVTAATARDEGVELIAQDRHVRNADDGAEQVEARRQSGSERDGTPIGADLGDGRRRSAAGLRSERRRQALSHRRVGAAVAGQGDEERAVRTPRHAAWIRQAAGNVDDGAGRGAGGGRGVLGKSGERRAGCQDESENEPHG